jgi:hypothetical protein
VVRAVSSRPLLLSLTAGGTCAALSSHAGLFIGQYNFAYYVFLFPLGLLLQPSGVTRGGDQGLPPLVSTNRPAAAGDEELP